MQADERKVRQVVLNRLSNAIKFTLEGGRARPSWGNIGSQQRAKCAVVGAAVNLAARVEGCTVGGQIFLTPRTYGFIRDLVEVNEPGSVEVVWQSRSCRTSCAG